MALYRTERLGQAIQEKIASLVLEGRIKDKRVGSFLSITRVNVSKDLSFADVYVSDIRGRGIEKGAEGLQSAAGFIQSQLGASMHIRKIPRLRFHADLSIGEGFDLVKKIEALTAADSNNITENEGPGQR
ncbi:MAG: 30S ribosome-binding factor RbfA [Treponema sp.]|jgi:ribosome-binding factor A|nr:30S ribosome-binding factor RbfA [Treponema sp.]